MTGNSKYWLASVASCTTSIEKLKKVTEIKGYENSIMPNGEINQMSFNTNSKGTEMNNQSFSVQNDLINEMDTNFI